jgi:beta-1,4-mannosyl-glycoprotein beta-1,4-N-acetylglucosaminyltransferase
MKTPNEIQHKLKSYLHHREFDTSPLSNEEIGRIMKNKKAIYNLKTDKRSAKFGEGDKLEKYPIEKLPRFLQNNINNYKEWID